MPNTYPIQGQSNYGNDWGAPRSGGRRHAGTDIFAKMGTPVVAVQDGKITAAGDDGGKGGLRIWLSGTWYYAHLSGLAKGITVGTTVKAGQVIGYVGDSGNAKGTSPHLHFGYDPKGGHSAGGSWSNPYPLLKAWQSGKYTPHKTEATPDPAATETQSTVAWDMEEARQAGIGQSMGSVGEVDQPVLPGVAQRGYAGQAPAIAPIPAPQIETWQSLSILPHANPDTMRYLKMAQEGFGDDAA